MITRIIASDIGLTGFISVVDITDNSFFVVDSFKISVEEKDDHVWKTGKTKALIKNQVSFQDTFTQIFEYTNKNTVGLIEQITHRPFNSALSGMSLSDTSTVFRCVFEMLDMEYKIIPPATWKSFMNVTKDKKTSKDLYERLIAENKIQINPSIKTLLKKSKNHNQVESVLIAYFYYSYYKKSI